jgi:hypothetical protein
MTDLRERCKAMYQKMQQDAVLRQGSPVDDLVEFVVSEIGRAADDALSDTLPLCLYFTDEESRGEFIAVFQAAKPNARAKKVL